ncbi:MAG: type II secretion system protein, partial [Alphaproteobacteria bacterium]|nr:type II secretion system protein [Alphaproteobacteria bacterium]
MKKYEKGSLMIEILAVLALISLITPMLFKQVSRRNEEVTRINVATEMRSIKDAMSAYIQTYEEKIASKLGLQDGSGNYTSAVSAKFEKLSEAEINELVGGFLIGNSGADYLHPEKGDYVLYFYGYTVPVYVDTAGVQLPASGDAYRP